MGPFCADRVESIKRWARLLAVNFLDYVFVFDFRFISPSIEYQWCDGSEDKFSLVDFTQLLSRDRQGGSIAKSVSAAN